MSSNCELTQQGPRHVTLFRQKAEPCAAVSRHLQVGFPAMTLINLNLLIANDDCCLDIFLAREGEVVSRLQPLGLAALEHERQSIERSANRTGPIQSIADAF